MKKYMRFLVATYFNIELEAPLYFNPRGWNFHSFFFSWSGTNLGVRRWKLQTSKIIRTTPVSYTGGLILIWLLWSWVLFANISWPSNPNKDTLYVISRRYIIFEYIIEMFLPIQTLTVRNWIFFFINQGKTKWKIH